MVLLVLMVGNSSFWGEPLAVLETLDVTHPGRHTIGLKPLVGSILDGYSLTIW